MPLEDNFFPQSGDRNDAERFAQLVGQRNLVDFVEKGLPISADFSAGTITVGEGVCYIGVSKRQASSDSKQLEGLGYVAQLEQQTVDMADTTGTNYVFVEPNFGTTDSPYIGVYSTSDGAIDNDALEIGLVDASDQSIAEVNRDPNGVFKTIDVDEAVVNTDLETGNITASNGSLDIGNLSDLLSVTNASGSSLFEITNAGNVSLPGGDLDVNGAVSISRTLGVNGQLTVSNDVSVDGTISVGTDIQTQGGTILWDSTNAYIPQARLENDSLTVNPGTDLVGGGEVALNGSITIDHADTSTQGNVSITGGTVIDTLEFDGRGHVQNVGTRSLDGRYLQVAGDTMAGTLDMGANDLVDGTTTIWDSTNAYIPQGRLENDSVSITAGNQLTGGGSVALGGGVKIDVDDGDGSGLNADLLDGVHLADIDWHHTSMAQSDVDLSDVGSADTDFDLNGYEILDTTGPVTLGGDTEVPRGSITQGNDPADTITESTSPKSFNFSGSEQRDIHRSTDVTISNSSGASATEDITVELYDGSDTTGTLLLSETQSISLVDGASTSATFIATDEKLDTGTYHIEVTQSGTALSIDQVNEHTRGGEYTLGQTATGDLFLRDQYGTDRLGVDTVNDIVEIQNSALQADQIESNGSSFLSLATNGQNIDIVDSANNQQLMSFSEGGPVEVKNADLQMNLNGIDRPHIIQFDNADWNSGDRFNVITKGSAGSETLTVEFKDNSAGTWEDFLRINNGGPVEVQNTDLTVAGDVWVNHTSRVGVDGGAMSIYYDTDAVLQTGGTGSDKLRLRDAANGQDLFRVYEGGPVEVLGADLDMTGNHIQDLFTIYWYDQDGDGQTWEMRERSGGQLCIGRSWDDDKLRIYDDRVEIQNSNFNLNQNQATNFVVENRSSRPSNPVPGQMIYRSDKD